MLAINIIRQFLHISTSLGLDIYVVARICRLFWGNDRKIVPGGYNSIQAKTNKLFYQSSVEPEMRPQANTKIKNSIA